MKPQLESLPDDVKVLKDTVIAYAVENDLLHEQVRLLRAQLYGRKSERMVGPNAEQLDLFSEELPLPSESEAGDSAGTNVAGHVRRKSGRRLLPDNLPRVVVTHDVTDAEKHCDCGAEKKCIGEEVSEQLDVVPARFQVLRHVRPKYACPNCEGTETNGRTVVIAPPPPQLIPKSIASSGTVATILTGKFVDGLPFYRQEERFARYGVPIGRATMCNLLMKVATKCAPVMRLLRDEIRAGPLIHCDETTLQVLEEPGREPETKSYVWLFRGGTSEHPAIEFLYSETRASAVAFDYLCDYQGAVQTDGYAGYDFLDAMPSVEHGGCWAHARRKFDDVLKAAGKVRNPDKSKNSVAGQAMTRIGELFGLEREARLQNLPPQALKLWRQAHAQAKLADFKVWLEHQAGVVPPKSLLGKAIAYSLNQWSRLERYAHSGILKIDNNLAENAIRPFVIGRKNWLFSGTPDGAHASAVIYSLVETAKANGLEPYWYLRTLFDRLPTASTDEEYRALLPQYIDRSTVKPRLNRGVH